MRVFELVERAMFGDRARRTAARDVDARARENAGRDAPLVIGALLKELRPKQWTKNLLLYAGVLFSLQLTEAQPAARARPGSSPFSLLSGVVYLLNDLTDVEADRRHPKKRLASDRLGRLPVPVAWAALLPILRRGRGAVVVARRRVRGSSPRSTCSRIWPTATGSSPTCSSTCSSSPADSVLRAIAGVELLRPVSPTTTISPWLLVCTFFGALFLALAKRRRELANAGAEAGERRRVLQNYTPEFLSGLLLVSAAASLMGYALYTIWPATVAKFKTEALLYTVPFVACGIFRYLYLVNVSEGSEDPSQVLLTDRPLAGCVLLYLLAVLIILYRA
mgnify:CR=1 FL=1